MITPTTGILIYGQLCLLQINAVTCTHATPRAIGNETFEALAGFSHIPELLSGAHVLVPAFPVVVVVELSCRARITPVGAVKVVTSVGVSMVSGQ